MSNVLAIILIVEIGLVFVPMVVLSTFSTLILKAFVARIEAVEYKLRQIPLPVETDLERTQEFEFENDGEIDPDDDSYSISEIREPRLTNSNGVPIARKSEMDSPE